MADENRLNAFQCVHGIFRRWEPLYIPAVTGLLVALPALLSSLLIGRFGILQAVIGTFILYWATLLASIVLYRLSPFHPLARYPGPVQARISKIWMTWIVSQGRQHLYIEEQHLRYGDVVRIGEPIIDNRVDHLTGTVH